MGNGNSRWPQFLISVLGTAIGVALTFSLNGLRANNKQEQAQRLTAIMVIHDIDNTIDILKTWKRQEASADTLLHYAMDNKNHLDKLPYDTLTSIFNHLVSSNSALRFDTSKEEIFNSDLDTWQNLGSVQFLDNVQSFFYDRQELQVINENPEWKAPIPYDDYLELVMGRGMVSQEQFRQLVIPFLKEKLSDKRVSYYVDKASYRVNQLSQMIDHWTDLNEENKFLMGITDQEMEDYINSFDATGMAVTKRLLTGTWVYPMENRRREYEFNGDHSFSSTIVDVQKGVWMNFSGEFKSTVSYNGTWELKGDSLVMNIDPNLIDFDVDASNLVAAEGMQDSLDAWKEKYIEQGRKSLKENSDDYYRDVYKVRMDSSKDKMQWTSPEGTSRYIKRKEI
jgi:hypothetical protein